MSTSFKEEEGDKAVEILLYPGPSPSRILLSKETLHSSRDIIMLGLIL